MLSRNTLILLSVFLLLLIVLLVVRRLPEREPEATEEIPTQVILPNVFDFLAEDVSGVRIENAEGEAVHFVREGDGWSLIQPPAAPEEVDSVRIESLVSQLPALRYVTETVLEADLASLGLDAPDYILNIILTSGGEHEILIGNASVVGTGYYVTIDGGDPQLVSKAILDTFVTLFDTPPLVPTPIPTLDPGGTITDTTTLEPEG